ncbi:MAG: hydrogenase iron-sulfur subunit [Candidatus Accumulibacter sp.]|uniref:hydrogenase iron-sulfur subunit n=1 Tax=Accumulibacter sp. TaxID=2053492 RepID=UPI0025D07992|nr:hydrogenase iron-sulfur subunit [Accumulibacter sp.]MCP5248013.1 hydrogenase iron-sulfur subunit [Accumulibacter sp.]
MSFHAALRNATKSVFLRVEEAFDAPFGGRDNPLRHLGAIGLYLLWIVVGSGLYLYTVLDTGIDAVYSSIGYLSQEQWYLGGVLRSLHRYASDGFMLVMMLHLLREWSYGRYFGFRLYSWMTGIPLIWLAYVAGIGGYWIVWDELAQLSATATTELLDWLPIFNEPSARNFLSPDTISDRFFTVLIFIHLGVPLLLILGLWAHVHRISHVDYLPTRRVMLATAAALTVLALFRPVLSNPPANLASVPGELAFDWFILFIHPLTDLSSPAFVWALLFGLTALLFALPLLPHGRPPPVAVVNPANCTGCDRCLADCPYAAISMAPHPGRPGSRLAVVDPDLCAACGICAGACPSSTPFRRREKLVTGIDMPQLSVNALREQLEAALPRLAGRTRIVVFACDRGAAAGKLLAADDTAVIDLMCTGMLPPAFVEYALRGGADGVMLAACREGGCEFRLGDRWSSERLLGEREPHLRHSVPPSRLQLTFASAHDSTRLATALTEFRTRIEALGATTDRLQPYLRRAPHHA